MAGTRSGAWSIGAALLGAWALAALGLIGYGRTVSAPVWASDAAIVYGLLVVLVAAVAVAIAFFKPQQARLAFLAGAIGLVGICFSPGVIAAVGLLFLAALGAGNLVTGNREARLWRMWLDFATGVGVIVAFVSTMVWFPVNTRPVYVILALLLIACTASRIAIYAGLARGGTDRPPPSPTLIAAGALMFATAALVLSSSLLPLSSADSLAVHTRMGTQLIEYGRYLFDVERDLFAFQPPAMNLLYSATRLIAGEHAHGALNVLVLAATFALLYHLAALWLAPLWAVLLTTLCMSTGMYHLVASLMSAEILLSLLIMAGLALIAHTASPTRRDWLVLAVLAGAMLAAKLTGLVFAGGLALVALVRWRRSLGLHWLATAAAGLVILLAIGSQFYVAAWILTGNPVFPFFNGIFQSPFFDPRNFTSAPFVGNLTWDVAYRLVVEFPRFGEAPNGASAGLQYLALIPIGLVWCAFSSRPLLNASLAGAAILIFLGLFSNAQYWRYVTPLFAVLHLAMVPMFVGLAGSRLRYFFLPLVVLIIGFNIHAMPAAWSLSSGTFNWMVPEDRRDAYLERQAPALKIAEYLNLAYGRNATVLMLGQPRGGTLKGVPLYVVWYNQDMRSRVAEATSPAEAREIVREFGITHVTTSEAEPRAPLAEGFRSIEELLAEHASPEMTVGSLRLYRLNDDVSGTELLPPLAEGNWEESRDDIVWRNGSVLAPDGSSLTFRTPVDPDLAYRLSIDARCGGDESGNFRLQVNFSDGDGQSAGVVLRPVRCRQQRTISSMDIDVPMNTAGANVYLVARGGAVEFFGASLTGRKVVQMGWRHLLEQRRSQRSGNSAQASE